MKAMVLILKSIMPKCLNMYLENVQAFLHLGALALDHVNIIIHIIFILHDCSQYMLMYNFCLRIIKYNVILTHYNCNMTDFMQGNQYEGNKWW